MQLGVRVVTLMFNVSACSELSLCPRTLPVFKCIYNFTVFKFSDSDKMIIATAKLKAGTLLGPLIAPLIPLDEPEDPSRYVLWSEDTQELLAYDLSNDYSCNWIKFMQPSWNSDEINVMAYQQGEFIYFITLKEMLPNTQLRVYVKIASCCEPPPGWIDVDSMDLELSLTQGTRAEIMKKTELYLRMEYGVCYQNTKQRGKIKTLHFFIQVLLQCHLLNLKPLAKKF